MKLIPQNVSWEVDLISEFKISAKEESELIINFDAYFANGQNIIEKFTIEEIEKKHFIDDYELLYSNEYSLDQPLLDSFSKDPLGYNKEKYRITRETGINPDPSFYLVENSKFLTKIEEKLGMRHYIIIGKESYIEIVGKDWTSESCYALFV